MCMCIYIFIYHVKLCKLRWWMKTSIFVVVGIMEVFCMFLCCYSNPLSPFIIVNKENILSKYKNVIVVMNNFIQVFIVSQ